MKVEMDECDECGKLIKNFYDEAGWIIFELKELIITKGRDDGGMGKSASKTFSEGGNLSFCSRACLNKYLNKLEEKQ